MTILEVKNFQFFIYASQSQLETFRELFDSLSKPFAIGAASLAFLTLGLTSSRTIRLDKQLAKLDEQLSLSRQQISLIEKQLEASYRPELFIDRFNINIVTSNQQEYRGRFTFFNKYMNVLPKMVVLNVGRAVAKSIEYEFSFDYRKAIEQIRKKDNMNYVKIESDDRVLVIDYKKEYINLEKVEHKLEYQLSKRFEGFIPDITQDKKGFSVNIPDVYLELYLIMWLILLLTNEIKGTSSNHYDQYAIPDFPQLKFHLSYKDLGNKIHIKDYIMSIIVPKFILPIANNDIIETSNIFKIEPKELE